MYSFHKRVDPITTTAITTPSPTPSTVVSASSSAVSKTDSKEKNFTAHYLDCVDIKQLLYRHRPDPRLLVTLGALLPAQSKQQTSKTELPSPYYKTTYNAGTSFPVPRRQQIVVSLLEQLRSNNQYLLSR